MFCFPEQRAQLGKARRGTHAGLAKMGRALVIDKAWCIQTPAPAALSIFIQSEWHPSDTCTRKDLPDGNI